MALEAAAPTADAGPLAALTRALRRFWWVVALVTLIAVAAAGVELSRRSTSYQARAALLLLPLPQYDQTFIGTSLLRDAGDPKLTASTAAEIVHSRNVAADGARRLADGTSADSVLASVDVTPAADANVLRITARTPGRARSVRLANDFVAAVLAVRWQAISGELSRRIAVLEQRRSPLAGSSTNDQLDAVRAAQASGADPTVQAVQLAATASPVATTSAAAVLILSLAGGAFLGLLAAVALDRLDGRLRDEDDALAAYSLPVWARVPRGRGGQVHAHQALAAHIDRWCPAGGAIGMISVGRGDGRTTAAAGLAIALAERGRDAVFIYLEDPPERALLAPLEDHAVAVIPATPKDGAGLGELVESARGQGEIAAIDGPPVSRGTELLEMAGSADLLLVVRIGHTRRHEMRRARDLLEGIGARPSGLLLLGVRGRRSDSGRDAESDQPASRPVPIP